MNIKQKTRSLTFTAILIALGILIPIIMPIKIVIGPASFTLGSHIPVFIAMFISPTAAFAVALGTALGFFLTFPFIIAFRALSHTIFAVIGAFLIQKYPQILANNKNFQWFNFFIAIIHTIIEIAVVSFFYFNHAMSPETYQSGYFLTIIGIMGVGGFIHSMIDFTIAFWLCKKLNPIMNLPAFTKK